MVQKRSPKGCPSRKWMLLELYTRLTWQRKNPDWIFLKVQGLANGGYIKLVPVPSMPRIWKENQGVPLGAGTFQQYIWPRTNLLTCRLWGSWTVSRLHDQFHLKQNGFFAVVLRNLDETIQLASDKRWQEEKQRTKSVNILIFVGLCPHVIAYCLLFFWLFSFYLLM